MKRYILSCFACAVLAAVSGAVRAEAQTFGLDGRAAPRADRIVQARALERRDDWPGLLVLGRDWARAEPDNSLAWFIQGRALAALGRHAEAIAAYENNLRLAPGDVLARNNLGNAWRDSSHPREAMRAYRAAVEADPDYLQAWRNLGLSFYLAKGQAGVARALERLRATDPALAELWQRLAVEYSATRDARTAEAATRALRGLSAARRARLLDILFDEV